MYKIYVCVLFSALHEVKHFMESSGYSKNEYLHLCSSFFRFSFIFHSTSQQSINNVALSLFHLTTY